MTPVSRSWLYHPLARFTQHLVFWVLSFCIFVQLFKTGEGAEKIDYIYTALFHATIIPAVYINLWLLLPRLANQRRWWLYVPVLLVLIALFGWLNYSFFQNWSKYLLPNYFFISYFKLWEVSLFFVVYIGITSLLKLSRSWFLVNELQRRLLQIETEKVQIELRALKAQVNPHFFFNTLNGIYSMTLDKDERLPQTVLQLSHLMRYFLYESVEDLVPLENEWQVLQDYISLQRIRSGANLQVELVLEGEIKHQRVAPLLLITFAENAFKHGAKGNTGAVSIHLLLQVKEGSICFRVQNTLGKVDEIAPDKYKGVGLENVRRRLALLYPNKHSLTIQETEKDFMVMLQLNL
jgi:sensor histidine kinase YesM